MAQTDQLTIFTDGGARGNPGPGAIGVVIKNSEGEILGQVSEAIGEKTNNEAEYLAVKSALDFLLDQNLVPAKIDVYLDSQLIYHQLRGSYKVKKSHLQKLLSEIKILESKLDCPIFFHLIPREQNQEADLLVNRALDTF